jgi:hypothetical protein
MNAEVLAPLFDAESTTSGCEAVLLQPARRYETAHQEVVSEEIGFMP